MPFSLDPQGLAVLPVLLSICGPKTSVTTPLSPRSSSFVDNWGDNHYDVAPSPSPRHYDDRSGGRGGYHDLGGDRQGYHGLGGDRRGYHDLASGRQEGASGWNWEGSGAMDGGLWGEEERAEGAPGGGAGGKGSLAIPLTSHMHPDGDVVL